MFKLIDRRHREFERDTAADRSQSHMSRTGRASLLLVARDASTRKWGTRWLANEGFEVFVARDAEHALELLAGLEPDAVVFDAGLKTRDGTGLCAQLRRIPATSEIPILALCSSRKEVRAVLDQRITDVVNKPYDWDVVTRRIGHLLMMSRTTSELDQVRSSLEEAQAVVEVSRDRIDRMLGSDGLTGLPNRATFKRLLSDAVNGSARGVALLIVDIDRFSAINEALGREASDEILVEFGQRLSDSLRGGDLLSRARSGVTTSAMARLSGDEFTVMMTNIAGNDEAVALAQHLNGILRGRFVVGDREVFLSTSAGVVLFPEHGKDANTLLQRAELALQWAKRRGGGTVCLYNESLNDTTERSIELSRLLHESFEREELELHYQPLIDSDGSRVIGAEALLRWEHPEIGRVSPAEFVPIAEESGLMVPIGTWVLRKACRQLRSWIDQGLPPIRMAINLSLGQLIRGDLVAVVREALEESRLDPSWIELELSERGVLRSDPDILVQLDELKSLGVRLSVDDFGTGNSAIAYLKRFPLDVLKIDRSYIEGVVGNENDAAITSATIAMAHKLKLEVVAEGVENEEQLGFLQQCECDEYQGFLFSPALKPAAFASLLERRQADTV